MSVEHGLTFKVVIRWGDSSMKESMMLVDGFTFAYDG